MLFVDTGVRADAPSIPGAACHIEDLRVILVPRDESDGRRSYDSAHELFHALTWDAMRPNRRESNALSDRPRARREGQLANRFTAALLMPQSSLDRLPDADRLADVGHLADAAAQLRVVPTALAWRLYNRIDDDVRRALMAEH